MSKANVLGAVLGIAGLACGAVEITADTKLAADTDWRGQGLVTIAEGAVLNLGGFDLQVDDIVGVVSNSWTDGELIVNGSFETNTGGIGPSTTYAYNSDTVTFPPWEPFGNSGIAYHNNPWNSLANYPDGDYGCFVQYNGGKNGGISQTFTVPADGRYTLRFAYSVRGGGNIFKGYLYTDLDGVNLSTVQATDTAFKYLTYTGNISAGQHVLKFHTEYCASASQPCINIDDVSFAVTASGATTSILTIGGKWTKSILSGSSFEIKRIAEDFTLSEDADWRDKIVLMASDSLAFNLNGYRLAVEDFFGGKLVNATSDSANLLANGSFETNTGMDGKTMNYCKDGSTCEPWVTYGLTGIGYQSNPFNSLANYPDGNFGVFLQYHPAQGGHSGISQTVNVARGGTYELKFAYSVRGGSNDFKGYLYADLDDVNIRTVQATSTAFTYLTLTGPIAAGEHVVKFRTEQCATASQPCLNLDDVSFSVIHIGELAINGKGTTTVRPGYEYTETTPRQIWWTGAGDDNDLDNIANWRGVNVFFREASPAVPADDLILHLEGAMALQFASGTTVAHEAMFIHDCTLTADCDWRGIPSDAEIKGAVDVKDHKLHLDRLQGSGSITSTAEVPADSPNLVANGGFETVEGPFAANGVWEYYNANNVTSPAWAWTGNAGISKAGNSNSPWIANQPCPDGTYACFLQCYWSSTTFSKLSQQLTVPDDGVYELAYAFATRGATPNGYLLAEIDTAVLGMTLTTSTTFNRTSHRVYLHAGTHTLTLRGSTMGSPDQVAPLVDDVSLKYVGAPGELHLTVPQGATFTHDAIDFAGNLRLVKEGAGDYVAAKAYQTYAGGTEVAAGKVRLPVSGSNSTTYVGDYDIFGARGAVIDVLAGTVLDLAGNYDCRKLTARLAGGTFANNGCDMTNGGYGAGNYLQLVEDSAMQLNYTTTFWGIANHYFVFWELGGHALTVNLAANKELRLNRNFKVYNGTLRVAGAGSLHTYIYGTKAGTPFDFTTVSLDVDGSALWLECALDVRDYTHRASTLDNVGSARLTVSGTFSPIGDKFYGCTLLDGATLDLNSRDTAWGLQSASANDMNTVSFVDGAQITLDVHERKGVRRIPNGTFLVDWSEEPPENYQTLSFVLDPVSAAEGAQLKVDDRGIWLSRRKIAIFFR